VTKKAIPQKFLTANSTHAIIPVNFDKKKYKREENAAHWIYKK